jgi:hypothetical protein
LQTKSLNFCNRFRIVFHCIVTFFPASTVIAKKSNTGLEAGCAI